MFPWKAIRSTFSGSAVSANTTLRIKLGDDLGKFLLDDVSVLIVAAPEPSTWSFVGAGILAFFLLPWFAKPCVCQDADRPKVQNRMSAG